MNLYSINAEYKNNTLNVSAPFKFALPDKGPTKDAIVNKVLMDIAIAVKPFAFFSEASDIMSLLTSDSEIKIENNELTLKYKDHEGTFKMNGDSWYMKGY
ncbi:hypothetical protein [Apilactobacillus timberlakei]|uniref:Uncharacterized protein n=1 Tax=Apilactobacillus timberlakei TaxID=2008380 RepID=A0ABY2YVJ3_9LACO|nr:hypothetical protein [Apilactobacillus timberlakei]TPR12750.1 hypothetical protein DY048_06990 [Apilactobacillus timberlakei]TPR13633.1 hypothetical protein DY052_07860 [Apilactobacillus timberlakei]